MTQKFYLTTPIYYVNARPHIGHAYTTIAADVLARRHRLLGDDVFFLTGTDEHGQKIERSAAAAGIPPQQFADEVAASFAALWQRMGITHNKFIRTTDPEHKRGVQKLFRTLQDTGAIYLDSYTGAYCVSDETFVDLPAGTPCPDCGRPLEIVTEENYFFRLSQYQSQLIELIESGTLSVEPEARRNEVLSFVRGNIAGYVEEWIESYYAKGGPKESFIRESLGQMAFDELPRSKAGNPYVPSALKDLSISRTSFQWGIPVPKPDAATQSPGAPFMERSDMSGKEKGPQSDHVIYVWLDALANYITAVGYGSDAPEDIASFAKYWPADLHLVGKEIIRFHCVYWPAFLLAAGIPLPKKIQAHGWLLFEESKMSKSRGNIVRTETILDAFGDHYRTSIVAQNKKLATDHAKLAAEAATQKDAVILSEARSAESKDTDTAPQGKNAVILSEARSAESKDPDASHTAPSDRPVLTEQPVASVSLKGTASAVPSDVTKSGAALAAEGVPFVPEPDKRDCDLFAADVLRYFLLREIPFGQDGSFSFDALITRYNADLANGYGNLVSRTLSMIEKYFDGQVPSYAPSDTHSVMFGEPHVLREYSPLIEQHYGEVKLTAVMNNIANLVEFADRTITVNAPWKLAVQQDDESKLKLANTLYFSAELIRIITALLHPVMPHTTRKVWAQLGLDPAELDSTQPATSNQQLATLSWGGLKPGTKLGPLAPIFPRAPKELAQVMSDIEVQSNPPKPAADPAPLTESFADVTPKPLATGTAAAQPPTPSTQTPAPSASPLITIDDFAKVDLRVARVLVAERIPKADKLLRLEVDLGYEKRQILAGIAQYYDPEKLIGRKVVIVANLAPRKMRGLESQGMVVAASIEPDGAPVLASFLEDVEIGARLK